MIFDESEELENERKGLSSSAVVLIVIAAASTETLVSKIHLDRSILPSSPPIHFQLISIPDTIKSDQMRQQQDDYCWNNNNKNEKNNHYNGGVVKVESSSSEWMELLPSPQELMPLTQSLITPHLALAFNIHPPPPLPPNSDPIDDQARTLKRPRLVWTPQLHKRFVDAVAHLGIKNAVPKTIMQLMSVDGLTRENVASHLQKYRLYLKRMQGPHSLAASSSAGDAAMDRLFASSPVPPQFLRPNATASADHFVPPFPSFGYQQQQQFRHFGSTQFDHPFIRQQQQQILRGSTNNGVGSALQPVYVEDLDSPKNNNNNGNKILTLFPTGS